MEHADLDVTGLPAAAIIEDKAKKKSDEDHKANGSKGVPATHKVRLLLKPTVGHPM